MGSMAEDLTEALGKNIPLSEMIESLRQELAVAIAKGDGQAIKFEVQSAEVQVELVAKKTKEGGGGVKFWVVTAEGKAAVEDETTHRLTLNLRPKAADGTPLEVARTRGSAPGPREASR